MGVPDVLNLNESIGGGVSSAKRKTLYAIEQDGEKNG